MEKAFFLYLCGLGPKRVTIGFTMMTCTITSNTSEIQFKRVILQNLNAKKPLLLCSQLLISHNSLCLLQSDRSNAIIS